MAWVIGMTVAILLGHGPDALVNIGKPGAKVRYTNMSLLGIRDVDPGEMALLSRDEVQTFSVFDVLEVGLSCRCGFDMREATYICRRLARDCKITSVDVVGLNPVRDQNKRTARRSVELLMALLGHDFSFSYDEYLRDHA